MQVKYTCGYKYQLAEDYRFYIDLPSLSEGIFLQFIWYSRQDDTILVRAGYAWDGPSGPTKDDDTNMRASLEHDVLYQLMRLKKLPQSFRSKADNKFNETAKEDGMPWWRRWYYLKGLRKFGGFAANPKNKKKIYVTGKK